MHNILPSTIAKMINLAKGAEKKALKALEKIYVKLIMPVDRIINNIDYPLTAYRSYIEEETTVISSFSGQSQFLRS